MNTPTYKASPTPPPAPMWFQPLARISPLWPSLAFSSSPRLPEAYRSNRGEQDDPEGAARGLLGERRLRVVLLGCSALTLGGHEHHRILDHLARELLEVGIVGIALVVDARRGREHGRERSSSHGTVSAPG